jgi:hypothetical protein
MAAASIGRPFLGYFDGGTDPAAVRIALVDVPSVEDPKMNLVTPGSLDESYLWQKVEGLQCKWAADCALGGSPYRTCGVAMPYQNPPLDSVRLTTIARWIAQGATGG